MRTSDFDYGLPPELIAQAPLPERDRSRMLVLHRDDGRIEHAAVSDLPRFLAPGDLLVLNDTRVFPARVFGRRRDTRGRVEALFIEPVGEGLWVAMCRTRGHLCAGVPLTLADGRIAAEVISKTDDGKFVLRVTTDRPLLDVLEAVGAPPLPPYINRPAPGADSADRERYQTVYAACTGAVAAPTAGLHFTPALLDAVAGRGVARAAVTLHVGPGTFRPVKAESVEDHVMDVERYNIPQATAAAVLRTSAGGGRVVAVGTTTVRTLESAAVAPGQVAAGANGTALFIRAPFVFRVVGALLTNFHLPRSTLLMLVSAFAQAGTTKAAAPDAGRRMVLEAYRLAVAERYRFYSFGDCMLIV